MDGPIRGLLGRELASFDGSPFIAGREDRRPIEAILPKTPTLYLEDVSDRADRAGEGGEKSGSAT